MSVFLLYFDDGPPGDLGQPHSQLKLSRATTTVRRNGKPLTKTVTVISDGIASDGIRLGADLRSATLRRDVAFLVMSRLLTGHAPNLLFHAFRGDLDNELIDVISTIDVAAVDLTVNVTRVQEPKGALSGVQRPGSVLEIESHAPMRSTSVAEGVCGTLADVLQSIPYDALLAFSRGPGASRSGDVGPKKKGQHR